MSLFFKIADSGNLGDDVISDGEIVSDWKNQCIASQRKKVNKIFLNFQIFDVGYEPDCFYVVIILIRHEVNEWYAYFVTIKIF